MRTTMRTCILAIVAISLAGLCPIASGYSPPRDPNLPGGYRYEAGYWFVLDYYTQDESFIGDAAVKPGDTADEADFEIWEMGTKLTSDKLYFKILTSMPESGVMALDSYADVDPVNMSPGDLWITVGSPDPFAETGPDVQRHAIALTDHANVVTQKYPGETWSSVTKGDLYTDAVPATATFETYQQVMKTADRWYYPDDQDGDDQVNSYMTRIKDFDTEVTGSSEVSWEPRRCPTDRLAGSSAVGWTLARSASRRGGSLIRCSFRQRAGMTVRWSQSPRSWYCSLRVLAWQHAGKSADEPE